MNPEHTKANVVEALMSQMILNGKFFEAVDTFADQFQTEYAKGSNAFVLIAKLNNKIVFNQRFYGQSARDLAASFENPKHVDDYTRVHRQVREFRMHDNKHCRRHDIFGVWNGWMFEAHLPYNEYSAKKATPKQVESFNEKYKK